MPQQEPGITDPGSRHAPLLAPSARPLAIVLATAALLLGLTDAAILLLTHGHVLFSQDDAYIHLALARHLADSLHYGINAAELSSPSSSILYPFLLALGLQAGLGAAAALCVCTAATLASAWLICRILLLAGYRLGTLPAWGLALLAAVLLVGCNLIGAAATGMEHALHIALTLAAIHGAQRLLQHPEPAHRTAWPWLACAALCPLVRYEGVSLWLAIVALLLSRRRWRQAAAVFTSTAAVLAAFSLWLHRHGLPLLPSSVLSKGGVAGLQDDPAGHLIHALQTRLAANLAAPGFQILAATTLLCAIAAILARRQRRPAETWLAGIGAWVGAAHLVIGTYGNIGRYEAYAICTTLVCALAGAAWLLAPRLQRATPARLAIVAASGLLALNANVTGTLETPLAARNIYDQQYQLHRFTRDSWRAPVGVNDIGLVSFDNPDYVLDLAGLASESVRQDRAHATGPDWMDRQARRHGAGLVMIYPGWFPAVPATWLPLGTLVLHAPQLALGGTAVAFYATSPQAAARARPLLPAFAATLPARAAFIPPAQPPVARQSQNLSPSGTSTP